MSHFALVNVSCAAIRAAILAAILARAGYVL
jgi:hypothetical protein